MEHSIAIYNKIVNDQRFADFIIIAKNNEILKFPHQILGLYIPYFENLILSSMKESSSKSVKVEFEKEDLLYLLWVAITGNLEKGCSSAQIWLRRYRTLNYFFPGKYDNGLQKIIFEADLDSKSILEMFQLGFDLSRFGCQITNLFRSGELSDLNPELASIIFKHWSEQPIDSILIFRMLGCSSPAWNRREIFRILKTAIENYFYLDTEVLNLVRSYQPGLAAAMTKNHFYRRYPYHRAKLSSFRVRMKRLIKATPLQSALDAIYKEIFIESFEELGKGDRFLEGWEISRKIYRTYKINYQKMELCQDIQWEIINHPIVKTANDFYVMYSFTMMQ